MLPVPTAYGGVACKGAAAIPSSPPQAQAPAAGFPRQKQTVFGSLERTEQSGQQGDSPGGTPLATPADETTIIPET